jgi:adenylate cyclase
MTTSQLVDQLTGSVLFTDLVGFTEYNDALGDKEALKVLEKQTELATQVVAGSAGSRIVKELGDGLMIWFGTAADGLAGASALLSAVADERATNAFPLAIRMGLHFGEAIPRGEDLVGQTINIAARVSDLAGPGELLVSESVLAACGTESDAHDLQPVGPVIVKGVHDPIWLHRLTLE